MSIKTYRPTTPARRGMTVSGFDGVDKHARPEKGLTEVLKKHAGRNSYGHITVRHQGGGNRQKYRVIDFKRDKRDVEAKVLRLEYDPNSSATSATSRRRSSAWSTIRTAARSSPCASMPTASAATFSPPWA